ncbi:SDR family NAD(P)-dependent oxidoreductase [Streptomyces sp. NPDC093252]|uniref:SDR family NAD(P)-dependent oxidoreductase n=1 Tax=Streptomyces sp. NPDC093252 TaxID=3154980 RepID=UPI0034157023
MTGFTPPFSFSSTAAEVAAGVDLTGRRALVTGASSGLGAETARVLAGCGAEVTLAVRDPDAGERTAKEITGASGGTAVRVAQLDLTDPASATALAARWRGPLHILVNNAGVMATPERYTPQGWELQFATNHLGHFALATALHGALATAGGARIVVVSSTGHQRSPVIFDDLHFAFRDYDPWAAYAQSKTANVLFAVEADRRWAADGVRANALMPGAVRTRLQRHLGGSSGRVAPDDLKSVAQGAATSVLLAASPLVEGVGGRYFENCREAEVVDHRTGTLHGVARYAVDGANARRLWEVSEELLSAGAGTPSGPGRGAR